MATLDVNAARAAGWTDAEIQAFAQQSGVTAQLQADQQAQNTAAMSHTQQPAPSGFLLHDPTEGMSTFDKALAGTGRGMYHTGASLGNLVGAVPDSTMADLKGIDAPLLNTGAGQAGNLIGEAAMTAPLGGAGRLGLEALGARGAAGNLAAGIAANRPLMGAAGGGLQGLATSDPGSRLSDTTAGAATGGLLGSGNVLVDRLVNGLKRTDAAGRLINQGVSLTPGQMNPTGIYNNVESLAAHLPFGVGNMVEHARDVPEHQWQAMVIGHGAAPGAGPIKPSGDIHDMLQQAYDSYAPLYDQSKGFPVSPAIVRTQGGNVPLSQAFQTASKAPGVPNSIKSSENEWLQDRLTQLPQMPGQPKGTFDSGDLLKLRSDIRERGRNANLKTDSDSGHVANIANRAEDQVTQAINSQLPPQPLAALAAADSNYGNFKTVEKAVAASKDNLAGLTPQKLSQAVYGNTQAPAYARGAGGDLRQMAQDGTETFQSLLPPTGKTVTGAGMLTAAGYLHPALTAALGTPAALMTLTPGGRAFANGTTRAQQIAQQLTEGLKANTMGRLPQSGQMGEFAQSLPGAAGQLGMSGATRALTQPTVNATPAAIAALTAALSAKKKEEGEAR
jgi:hypothetical protein